ncbi:MAG: acyl-CoA dehydrogenase family protein [Nitrososphaerales archaeon]
MTLELTQEQQILRETVREFAQNEIAPLASKIDRESLVPQELLSKLPKLGLFGISVPSDYGGAGADFLSLMIVCEEVSKASGSLGAQISFHNAVVCEALVASTNAGLKESLLSKLASGTLGAFDFPAEKAKSEQITCKIEGSELIVNGSSQYVTSASKAGIFIACGDLVGTKSDRILFAFSRDDTSQGAFSTGEPRKLMGMRASGTASVSFDNMRLPLQSLVCEVPKTGEYLGQLLARARLAVASQALGIAQASIEAEVRYANERKQFDTKIGNFYAVQEMIASDAVDVETSRSLCYLTSSEILSGNALQKNSAIAKVAASNAAVKAARHAIRVHGGYGFTRAYPVERYARDARITQIYTETNEDLKSLIARSLLGEI